MSAEPLIILSDLHLGAGRDQVTGHRDPHDPFDHDEALASFLDHLVSDRPHEHAPARVLVLGDLLDFPSVAAPGYGRRASSARAALAKLEVVTDGHPGVFAALRRYLAAGGRLELVAGNHDLELLRPSLQERLAAALGAPGAVTFHPWIYYLSGVVYAEHGHQHHDINALTALLEPEGGPPTGELEQPPGTILHHHVLDLRDGTGARAVAHARFAATLVQGLVRRLVRGTRRRRTAYRARVVAAEAARVGLPAATLAKIDALSATSTSAMVRRLLRTLLRRETDHYLVRGMRAVHDVLARDGHAVPLYAVAHSHRPLQAPLHGGPEAPVLLNAGTWTGGAEADGGATLTFIEIRSAAGGGRPSARLLRWDLESGRARPVADGDPPAQSSASTARAT
jgi:Calcineurin-like phosphoesterase